MKIKTINNGSLLEYFNRIAGITKLYEDDGQSTNIPLENLIQNLRRREGVQFVPVGELQALREFQRRGESKFADAKIESLKNSILKQGFTDPVIIRYSPSYRTAFITEGNHRLNAAEEIGLRYVPTLVLVEGDADASKGVRVIGKEPDEDGNVDNVLFPSQIGIDGCLSLTQQPVSPEPDWEDNEDDEAKEGIQPLTQYTDIVESNDNYVKIAYTHKDSPNVLDLFGSINVDAALSHLSSYVPRNVSIEWSPYDAFNLSKEEEFFSKPYRTYLSKVLGVNTEDDFELYDIFEKKRRSHKDMWYAFSEMMYANYYKFYNKKVHDTFFYGDYEDMNYNSLSPVIYNGQISLVYSLSGLKEFAKVDPNETLLKNVIDEEFKRKGYIVRVKEVDETINNMGNINEFPLSDLYPQMDKLIPSSNR